MLLRNYYYDLPSELIAQYPAKERSGSQLFYLHRDNGNSNHLAFNDLPQLLKPNDLLIFNDTKVIPARLFGRKPTGGQCEILIERMLSSHTALAMIRASKSPKIGSVIILEDNTLVEVLSRETMLYQLNFQNPQGILELIDRLGHMPLPPYMQRNDQVLDKERYQTVYAKNPGAVAAPTAGLHFDQKLMQQLTTMGIAQAFITLHVGLGTFQPVKVQNILEHKMHGEFFRCEQDTIKKIIDIKAKGGRIVAVGTTTVRCLESIATLSANADFEGMTDIFIYPGYEFKWVDALITNFHLPESTLLMLVCAFAGYEHVMKAYQEAIKKRYRFYSYGDAMFIA